MEYGNPTVDTALVSIARCAPFSFTTMPMISTSSGGSRSFKTSSESVICGTAFGETNDAASMCLNPALIKAFRYSTLMSAGICPFNPCQASRGHSTSLTEALGICHLAFGSWLFALSSQLSATLRVVIPGEAKDDLLIFTIMG